jgi:hypothetical protein
MRLRSLLKNNLFIHFLVILSFFTLWGYIETGNKYLLLGILASVTGAICGAFILVLDTVRTKR